MRDALKKSRADRRDGTVRHPAGSVVVCNGCMAPLYVLESAIDFGMKAAASVGAFAPIRPGVIEAMATSPHVEAGLRQWAAGLTHDQRVRYSETIPRPSAGDAMRCPFCFGSWAQVLTTETSDTGDRAYTIELVTVQIERPSPPIRGRLLGADREWVH